MNTDKNRRKRKRRKGQAAPRERERPQTKTERLDEAVRELRGMVADLHELAMRTVYAQHEIYRGVEGGLTNDVKAKINFALNAPWPQIQIRYERKLKEAEDAQRAEEQAAKDGEGDEEKKSGTEAQVQEASSDETREQADADWLNRFNAESE